MVTSSQEKSQRSKPLLRLETSLHTMTARRKHVDTSTATYHPKDEPHKRDFDKHAPPKDRENEKKQEPPNKEGGERRTESIGLHEHRLTSYKPDPKEHLIPISEPAQTTTAKQIKDSNQSQPHQPRSNQIKDSNQSQPHQPRSNQT
ncbi:hypothetical protein YC2023_055068 [Brassica napus]